MSEKFTDMLKEGESLFRDTVPLDYDYLPKVLPYREDEQEKFAHAIRPLMHERNGKNLFVYGEPGIGKTAACRHVLRDLEKETEEIETIYINCWKHNTTYKTLNEICDQLNIRIIGNQKSSELFEKIKSKLNKTNSVFVFDEIDKLNNFDVIYMILEDIYRKSIFLITNYEEKVKEMDERITSRLNPEYVEFKPYNAEETKGILKERKKYAFVEGVWKNEAFSKIIDITAEEKDIRKGLFLMKEAGNVAEEQASKKIKLKHVKEAISRSEGIEKNDEEELDSDLKKILSIIKENSGEKIGDIYDIYEDKGGDMSYRNFQRKINTLEEGRFIKTESVKGGSEGNTTLVHAEGEKKLTDF